MQGSGATPASTISDSSQNKNMIFLCYFTLLHYLWLSYAAFRMNKNKKKHIFVLFFAQLALTLHQK